MAVELRVSPAEVIEGVGEEIERLAGTAGLLQAEQNFRCVRGYKATAKLLTALDRTDVADTT